MTPQIKERIEQIRCGEVPEGYKKTKAGIVPEEWEEKRIGDVLTQRKTLMCISEDVSLLSFTIEEGVIDPADKKSNKRDFLIKDMATKKFALTEVGDIIYNPANLKFGAIHRNNLRRGVVSPIYGIFYGEQDSVFMGYLLHNQRFIDYAKIYTEGTVEKLKTLKADTFLKLKITLPTLTEQKKITEIISAQDKLIELKEKLIEEKKKQKKYLMQQLLTGKRRLPGFGNEWQKKRVSDFALLITDSINPCDFSNELFNVYSLPSYDNNRNPEYLSGAEMNSNKFIITQGMILFNKLNVRQKRVWYVESKSTKRMLSSTEFLPLKVNNINPKFLTQYLLTDEVTRYFIVRSSGTSNSQQRILPNDLMRHSLFIPEIDEQNKIVEILETYDREIELFQKELYQEKQKKKALMQLLLTGIVRVS